MCLRPSRCHGGQGGPSGMDGPAPLSPLQLGRSHVSSSRRQDAGATSRTFFGRMGDPTAELRNFRIFELPSQMAVCRTIACPCQSGTCSSTNILVQRVFFLTSELSPHKHLHDETTPHFYMASCGHDSKSRVLTTSCRVQSELFEPTNNRTCNQTHARMVHANMLNP